jgi:CheY-like chemotaxis protein
LYHRHPRAVPSFQIIVNFISNAITFSSQGSSVLVSVQVTAAEDVENVRASVEPMPRVSSEVEGHADAAGGYSKAHAYTSVSTAASIAPSIGTARDCGEPADKVGESSSIAVLASVDVGNVGAAGFPIQRVIGSVDVPRFLSELQRASANGDVGAVLTTDVAPGRVVVLEFAVADAGCGLTQADAERLFEAFQQVDAGIRSSQYKGRSTGLGLAISRRLALAHCGSIGVRSGPSVGSVFFLRIPAAVVAVQAAGESSTPASPAASDQSTPLVPVSPKGIVSGPVLDALARSRFQAENKSVDAAAPLLDASSSGRQPDTAVTSTHADRRHPLRLLVVDDSAVNKRMLLRALQYALPQAALEVVEAADGAEGLRTALESSPPSFDVCLCDAEMPVMNGYEMVAALRGAGSALPVIGVTDNALPADVQRFLDAGASAVVTKPVRMQQLLQAMRVHVEWL